MKTLVYMIRHGESEGNAVRSFLGHTDLPLTERGRGQARDASAYLEKMGIRPDVAYASPLCRAYETARLALSHMPDLPIHTSDGLREVYAGKWENMLLSDIEKEYGREFEAWRTDLGNACPNEGESVKELAHRVRTAVLRIAAENQGKTVLIASHATPVRAFETLARGWDIERAREVNWPANASLSAYLCEGETVLPLFYALDSYLTDGEDPTWMGR